ncbi:MAG TPA: aldo/keto reductase [Armatimonadetes bacterium]|nr:aldo/keto reductase [Armatimonadota bacterium]
MIYRKLGRTGLRVSQLGFGCMRLPMKGGMTEGSVDRELAVPMLHRAFEAGVNYVDTAVGYCNGDSQRAVGDALKGWRHRIIVSTKNPDYGIDEAQWWRHLEESLERLQTDYIDIYNHHGISWERYEEHVLPRVSRWMVKAKEQGLIRHICCSFHDDNEALKRLVDTGYPEVITVQYNLLDRGLEEGIAYAHEKGVGIVVMGPVGGGRLGAPSEVLGKMIPGVDRVPELALRFVLANPHVSVALSGMSTLQQVEENIATASSDATLSEAELAAIDEQMARLRKMADLYCSGCRYCLPCPNEVNIPVLFELYNTGRVYGLWDVARARYAKVGKIPWLPGKTADACVECGECEEKCPQRIAIRAQLAEAHRALTT